MDNARFGQTQFQERLTFQRGLEGELIRSITSLAAVQNARVHLAMPNQNGFFREQQKPSASVLLTLHPGRTLDRAQVAGIVHLVASSVPELDPKAVSVLDQTGALLSGAADASAAGGLDAEQLQLARAGRADVREAHHRTARAGGRPRQPARHVAAELDFSQSEQTSEEFRPNQGEAAKTAVRSQQSSEQSGAGAGTAAATGVPGAASNQPPLAASAPLAGASAAPLQPAQAGAAAAASGRRDATTNYEVDKTVRVTRNATGLVKRLNAAVVVNHRSVTDAKGRTTSVALTAEELEKLTALVQQGIGFDAQRGDSVKVVNAPFRVQTTPSVELPLWKQPETIDLVRGCGDAGGARRGRPARRLHAGAPGAEGGAARCACRSRPRSAARSMRWSPTTSRCPVRRPRASCPPSSRRARRCSSNRPAGWRARTRPRSPASSAAGSTTPAGPTEAMRALRFRSRQQAANTTSIDEQGSHRRQRRRGCRDPADVARRGAGRRGASGICAPREVQKLGETIARRSRCRASASTQVLDRFDDGSRRRRACWSATPANTCASCCTTRWARTRPTC